MATTTTTSTTTTSNTANVIEAARQQAMQAASNTANSESAELDTISISGEMKFKPYDSKAPIPPSFGGRIVKVMYKATKDKSGELIPAELPNACMEVPLISSEVVRANIEALLPHIVGYLETVQDSIVRDNHKLGATFLAEDALGMEAIITNLESSGTSGRFNKEQLNYWFDEHMQDGLYLLFADKLGCTDDVSEEQEAQIQGSIAGYRDAIGKLASPKVSFAPERTTLLIRAITLCELEDNTIGARLLTRLNKMLEKKPEDELLSL